MAEPTFLSDDEIILAEFVDESEAALAGMDQLFVSLEQAPADVNTVNAIFRPIHSLKANSAFLGLMHLKALAHAAESLLDGIRKQELQADRAMIDLLLKSVDELKAITGRIRNQQQEVLDPTAFQDLLARLVAARNGQVLAPAVQAAAVPAEAAPVPSEAAPVQSEAASGARTLRVAVDSIDALSLVTDELIHVQTELNSLAQSVTDAAGPLQNRLQAVNQQFDDVLARIRQGLSAIRKVPLQELFQKIPRVVRDTAASCHKQATARMTGGNILVSRELVQLMDAPLVHMLRNSVDHGAELPDERIKAGKPAECTVSIQAHELPGELVITIADDGRGIDFKALLLKALKMGGVKAGQKLTPEDMTNLIFLPGLSTAKQVTDVSGRGIGMDVVREAIQKLGGKVEVTSKPGLGTSFMICLPNPE